MGGGGSKTRVTDYYLSAHLGVSHGPVDLVNFISVGEKKAWSGAVNGRGVTKVNINNRGLFGGNKQEGGVAGSMFVMNGAKTQMLPKCFATKLGSTIDKLPAFRGMLSLLFCEANASEDSYSLSGRPGFYWASNNAYIKSLWVNVSRWAKFTDYFDFTPTAEQAAHIRIGNNMNPAWIILEVVINRVWGMGIPKSMVNVDMLLAVAKTLYDEGFGMSILWSDQTEGESFISEIMNHVSGTWYTNPFTGLIEVKLFRDDYDVATLPVITSDDCVVTSYQKKSYSETTNEVVVKYTSPDNEELTSVTVHNLANINIQGAVVSQTIEYAGIRDATLATKCARRDLRSLSTPLVGVEVELNSKAWKLTPGQVVILNYPEYEINGLVMRVGEIDYGTTTDRTIKVSMTEDVFGGGVANFEPQLPLADASRVLPSPIDDVFMLPAPFGVVARDIGTAAATQLSYPACPFIVLVSEGDQISSAETLVKLTPSSEFTSVGDSLPQSMFTLTQSVNFEATTTLHIGNAVGYNYPVAGDLMVISNPANVDLSKLDFGPTTGAHEPELVYVVSSDSSAGTVVVNRGCFDTLPYAWPVGSKVRLMSDKYTIIPDGGYGYHGIETIYHFYPRNINGQTIDSTDHSVVGTERIYKPYRAANVKLNGALYPASVSLPISLTWASRNRLIETGTPMLFTDTGVTAEANTTYQVTLSVKAGGNVYTLPVVTTSSTSATITTAMVDAALSSAGLTSSQVTEVLVVHATIRDGYTSHMPFKWRCNVTA